jgi:Domain of unknown function (DUF5122) beta-propeller
MPKSVSVRVGKHRRVRYLVPGILLASLVASGALLAATAPVAAAATTPGSIDTTFGTGGWRDIILSGSTGLARLLPSGQPDKSFGSGGTATVPGAGTSSNTAAVAVQSDGKIIYAGATSSPDGGSKWELARFTANGALDPPSARAGSSPVRSSAPRRPRSPSRRRTTCSSSQTGRSWCWGTSRTSAVTGRGELLRAGEATAANGSPVITLTRFIA